MRADLEHEAGHEAEREMRADLLRQLAVAGDASTCRRRCSIARSTGGSRSSCAGSIEQQIDPMRTNINWEEFRERQREAAAEAVRSALVLDEMARREGFPRPTPRSTRKWSDTPNEPAGRRRPCGPGWKRKAGLPASTRGCAARRRWISCCRGRPCVHAIDREYAWLWSGGRHADDTV